MAVFPDAPHRSPHSEVERPPELGRCLEIDRDRTICLDIGHGLLRLVRPTDLKLDGAFVLTKSKVQRQFVLIAFAGARFNVTCQHLAA